MSGGGPSAPWGRGYVTAANGLSDLELLADDVRAYTDIEQKSLRKLEQWERRRGAAVGQAF